jgi:hypothetical protein
VQSDQADPELLESIKAKKSIILIVGFLLSLILALVAFFLTEDTLSMVILFVGIIAVGFIWTWVVTTKVESRMLGGRSVPVQATTPAQRASVATSSLVTAAIVLHTDYGLFLAPFIIVIFNGGLFLYDRQMRAKRVDRD